MIIHNETNDSDKISHLFSFEKTHPTPLKKKPLKPQCLFLQENKCLFKKQGQKKSVKAIFCISCPGGPNKIIVRLIYPIYVSGFPCAIYFSRFR